MCNKKQLTANGGGGYAHILKDLVPRLRHLGVTDQDLRTIMEDNPRRLFPLRRYQLQMIRVQIRSKTVMNRD